MMYSDNSCECTTKTLQLEQQVSRLNKKINRIEKRLIIKYLSILIDSVLIILLWLMLFNFV